MKLLACMSFLMFSLFHIGVAHAQDATENDYELKTATTTKDLRVGTEGTWGLQIVAKNGFKVSDETPLTATLSASEGLTLKSTKVARKDAVVPKSPSPEWKVGMTATKAGSYDVTANIVFFLCTEKLCQRMTTKNTVTVVAK